MTWRVVLLSVALLAKVPAQHVELRAAVPVAGIAFGEAFDLEVVVQWPTDDELAPIDPRQFAPLQVELLSSERRGSAAGPAASEWVRHYRARALAVGELVVGPVLVAAASGAATARSAPLLLRTRSSLPDPAGALEWPGDVREAATAARAWLLVAAFAAVSGFAAVWWWRRARRSTAVPAPRAADDLAGLLAALPLPTDAVAVARFYRDVKALLRAHASRCHRLRADVATSEELLAALPRREVLARCLSVCDAVLFAASQPTGAAHGSTRALAVEWISADVSEVA